MLIDEIQKKVGYKTKYVESFEKCCPFSMDELRKGNRKREIALWRHIGIVWYRLNGYGYKQIASIFNRNHAIVNNSEKRVFDALLGYDPEIKQIFNDLLECDLGEFVRIEDENINLVNALIQLENVKKF